METTKECPICGGTFTRKKHSKQESPKYCSRACSNKAPGRMTEEIRAKIGRSGEDNPNWINGQWTASDGRVFILVPPNERHLHPTIRNDGYMKRYQYIWNTAHPEDPVCEGYVIHHKNEDRTDDRIENLEKISNSDHTRHHGTGRKHTVESRERMRVAQLARRARERDSA